MDNQINYVNRYSLSVNEAADYFHIGVNKIRNLINENLDADYILWNGSRPQIKRAKFEQFLDKTSSI